MLAIGEEFESLLKLRTNSIVVHADETNGCIGVGASVLDKLFPNQGKPLPAQLAASEQALPLRDRGKTETD